MSPKKASVKPTTGAEEAPVHRSARTSSVDDKASVRFSDEERAAMKERALELKAEALRGGAPESKAAGDKAVRAKIAELYGPERTMAVRLHALIMASAPTLSPKVWYGMPAYAKDGKVVCYFQSARRFKSRYVTLGFTDEARLDEGIMWPTSFALKGLSAAEATRIGTLVKRAVR